MTPSYVINQPGNHIIEIPSEFCDTSQFIFYGSCLKKNIILFFGSFKDSSITRLYAYPTEDASSILNKDLKFGFMHVGTADAEVVAELLKIQYSFKSELNDWLPLLNSTFKLKFTKTFLN